jgi:succinate dehydrogenase/fumarate reductase flavoprotein subunit
VWGGICGEEIAKALPGLKASAVAVPEAKLKAAEGRIKTVLRKRPQGQENLYELRRELRATDGLERRRLPHGRGSRQGARDEIASCASGRSSAPVDDKGTVYNSNLFHAIELENLLDLAEVTVDGRAGAAGVARRARAARLRHPRRREVAEAHAGLVHG